jgi:hypothetical protein
MSIDDDDYANDPANAPLIEAGEGESEGFELAEEALIENASHGNEHSAGRILEDAFDEDEEAAALDQVDGEADEELKPDLGDDDEDED